MKRIPLTKGHYALVDDQDYALVSRYNWCAATKKNYTAYAVRSTRKAIEGVRKTQQMHRLIMGVTDPTVKIDHKDGNGLNNRRENLRKATSAQNQFNRRVPTTNTSGCVGVVWHKRRKRWRAQISGNRQYMFLGDFKSKSQAARARALAVSKYHGEFGRRS